MKKILLSAVALFATMTVNAQEVGQITTDDLVNRIGLTTDKEEKDGKMQSIKIDVAAGTMFCESANVTMSAAFDDGYSPESAAAPKIDDANYGTIKIGDLTIDATQGVQGNSNPKDEAGANPALASTVPVGPAAVFQFDVKKNGYLYVFHKASSNKNYMVYENKAPMGYIFTMATDGTKALPKVFGYELKGEGEFNYLPEGTAVAWPEKIYLGEEAEDVKVNGLSVIKFPVFEGCSYWVNAGGSKITSCGYYFDETGDATVTIENGVSEAITILDKGQIPGAEPKPVAEPWKIEGAEGAMEYDGSWKGNWWNLNEDMNADISGYDYLWIDYDGFEGAIQFGIFYSEWQKTESWGEVWYTDQVDLTDAAGVVGIKIEKTKIIETGIGGVESEYKGDIYAKHARQVFTQDKGKASKINIKGIYLGSEADFEAAKAGGSAINSVKKAANADGAIYNIAGQKVSASYKGMVIKDGKKFIQK